MKIVCPSCQLSGNLDDRQVPPGGRQMECPRCRASFRVEPPDQFAVSSCPACQYATFSEETFSICPQCGVSVRGYQERLRKQQERDRLRATLDGAERTFANPDLVKNPLHAGGAETVAPPAQPVAITSWCTMAVGGLLALYGIMALADYYGKDWQAVYSAQLLVPVSRVEIFFRLGCVPWLALLYGAGLAILAGQLLRLRAWAYRALLAYAWGGIGVGAVRELLGYIQWVRISSSSFSFSYHAIGIVTALGLTLLWSLPVLALQWVLHQEWFSDEFPD